MKNNEEAAINVMVKCPVCKHRLFNKITAATGKLEIKCPNCRNIVSIDLAFRLSRRPAYRPQYNRIGY